jgi:hypothetical protein
VKAAPHVRILPRRDSAVSTPRPRLRLPRTRQVRDALRLTLALVLFGTGVWWSFWHAAQGDAPPAQVPAAGLELVLSGALTGPLSLSEAELRDVRCGASGFRVVSSQTVVFPLELTFTGVATEMAGKRSEEIPAAASYYVLGSEGELTLSLDRTTYTLLSGTVTTAPGGWRFSASLIDAQSQPLQLSGRLVCPATTQGQKRG